MLAFNPRFFDLDPYDSLQHLTPALFLAIDTRGLGTTIFVAADPLFGKM